MKKKKQNSSSGELDRTAPVEDRPKNSNGNAVGSDDVSNPDNEIETYNKIVEMCASESKGRMEGKANWQLLMMDMMMLYMAIQSKNLQAVHMAVDSIILHSGMDTPA